MNRSKRKLIFADIEASGLQFLSFPIEFGWAWAERDHVKARSVLIKPSEEWLSWKTGWNPEAERLHGISLDFLMADGIAPPEVCSRLNKELREQEVAFDTGSGSFDSRWLTTLYRAGKVEPNFALSQLPSDANILAYARMQRIPDPTLLILQKLSPKATHRAAPDAAQWAWWQVALRRIATVPANPAMSMDTQEVADLVEGIEIRSR